MDGWVLQERDVGQPVVAGQLPPGWVGGWVGVAGAGCRAASRGGTTSARVGGWMGGWVGVAGAGGVPRECAGLPGWVAAPCRLVVAARHSLISATACLFTCHQQHLHTTHVNAVAHPPPPPWCSCPQRRCHGPGHWFLQLFPRVHHPQLLCEDPLGMWGWCAGSSPCPLSERPLARPPACPSCKSMRSLSADPLLRLLVTHSIARSRTHAITHAINQPTDQSMCR